MAVFVKPKRTMRVCEANMSMRQIVSSEIIREVLCDAHPTQRNPPKSIATVRSYSSADAELLRDDLRVELQDILFAGELCFPHALVWQR